MLEKLTLVVNFTNMSIFFRKKLQTQNVSTIEHFHTKKAARKMLVKLTPGCSCHSKCR